MLKVIRIFFRQLNQIGIIYTCLSTNNPEEFIFAAHQESQVKSSVFENSLLQIYVLVLVLLYLSREPETGFINA